MTAKKMVVWDLDNTIWDGTLSEGDNCVLHPEVEQVIKELDARGILQSISSKNDYDLAWKKLEELGISDYFIYPQINWSSKSSGVAKIIKDVNIAKDSVVFIDDQKFELEEVKSFLPEVECVEAKGIASLLTRTDLIPEFITDDSKNRRKMYQSAATRNKEEKSYVGPEEDFIRSLNMKLTFRPAKRIDLERAEELTLRTHQLNSTGYTYSFEELENYLNSKDHILLVARLEDRFGTYGMIGLALIETKKAWELKLLLTSCRVMSRGIGGVLLDLIIKEAVANGKQLFAYFVPTDRNRIMYITYKMKGFEKFGEQGENLEVLKYNSSHSLPKLPEYIDINASFRGDSQSDGIGKSSGNKSNIKSLDS